MTDTPDERTQVRRQHRRDLIGDLACAIADRLRGKTTLTPVQQDSYDAFHHVCREFGVRVLAYRADDPAKVLGHVFEVLSTEYGEDQTRTALIGTLYDAFERLETFRRSAAAHDRHTTRRAPFDTRPDQASSSVAEPLAGTDRPRTLLDVEVELRPLPVDCVECGHPRAAHADGHWACSSCPVTAGRRACQGYRSVPWVGILTTQATPITIDADSDLCKCGHVRRTHHYLPSLPEICSPWGRCEATGRCPCAEFEPVVTTRRAPLLEADPGQNEVSVGQNQDETE